MVKPTAEESRKIEVNRQIKKIWEERLGRDKNEVKLIFGKYFFDAQDRSSYTITMKK